MENLKIRYTNYILISTDWDIQHRKPLLNEFVKKSSSWSDNVIVQQPVFLLAHLYAQFKRKILGLIKGRYKTKKLSNGAILFTPVALFTYSLWLKFKFMAIIDSFIISFQINKFHQKYFNNSFFIFWVFYPCHFYLLNRVKYDYLIYDFFDNFELYYDGSKLETDSFFNELLIKKSDLILCLARQTFERAKLLNKNAFYFPSGNNFEMLSKANDDVDIPELDNIKQPMICYLGAIRRWMDFDLLKNLFTQCKEIMFVFIGFVNRDTKNDLVEILKYPNTKLINYIEQDKLAAYLRKFKAGLIPFKVNKFMDSVFPNKFLEYLATGLPVITTALKELEPYSDLICYAKTDEEFIRFCKEAVNHKFSERRNEYIALAKQNSWSSKAERLNAELLERTKIL